MKFIRETELVQDSFVINNELGCTVNAPCNDGDICTVNDQLNANCQCIGTPIGSVPASVVLNAQDSPLHETYKASQLMEINGIVATQIGQLTTLIAQEVSLQPVFSVPLSATFVIRQSGCSN